MFGFRARYIRESYFTFTISIFRISMLQEETLADLAAVVSFTDRCCSRLPVEGRKLPKCPVGMERVGY